MNVRLREAQSFAELQEMKQRVMELETQVRHEEDNPMRRHNGITALYGSSLLPNVYWNFILLPGLGSVWVGLHKITIDQ